MVQLNESQFWMLHTLKLRSDRGISEDVLEVAAAKFLNDSELDCEQTLNLFEEMQLVTSRWELTIGARHSNKVRHCIITQKGKDAVVEKLSRPGRSSDRPSA